MTDKEKLTYWYAVAKEAFENYKISHGEYLLMRYEIDLWYNSVLMKKDKEHEASN